MSAYGNDPRVDVNRWGTIDREVTYTVNARFIPAEPPRSDLDWSSCHPGDSIVVKYIQDGVTVNGWVVDAENDAGSARMTTWGAYMSADAALANVLGDPR